MDPDQVTFNESYRQLWQPLPASQRREAVKRLTTRRKDPLPLESLGDEHPDIEACLTRLSEAYQRKKVRCAKTSAQRRFQRKRKTADAVAAEPVAEVVAVPAAAPAAEIVAVIEAEPTQASADEEPAPAPKGAKPLQPAQARDLEGPPAPVKKKAARARAKPAPAPPAPAAPVDTPPASVDTPPAQAPQKARSLLSKRAPSQGGVPPPASSVGRPLIDRRGGTPTPGS